MFSSTSGKPADDAVVRVLNSFMEARAPVYIVGGAVRDHLLGISTVPGWSYKPETRRLPAGIGDCAAASPHPRRGGVTTVDLDLVFSGPVLPVARRVANLLGWAYYPLDEERDVARLIGTGGDGQRLECDVAALRGDLRADLFARDFTVNALALRLSADGPPQLIDLCGGRADLEARRLCRITPDSLRSDPIRLLRAVRLAAQLDFTIEDETRAQIKASAATVLSVSIERVRDELWKLLDSRCPHDGIEALRSLGLLAELLPEIDALQGVAQSSRHHLDVYGHSLLAAQYAAELRNWLRGGTPPRDEQLAQILIPWTDALRAHFTEEIAAGHDRAGWLVWHSLFHDSGKGGSRPPATESGDAQPRFPGHEQLSAELTARRIANLHFSRREALLAERVAAAHGRPRQLFRALPQEAHRIGQRPAFGFFRDIGSVTEGHQIMQGPVSAGGASQPAFDGLDVTLLAIADNRAAGPVRGKEWPRFLKTMESLLAYAFSRPPEQQTPLVDGHILMQHLGLSPGPAVGALLHELAEAQAGGELANVAEALALAEELYAASHFQRKPR